MKTQGCVIQKRPVLFQITMATEVGVFQDLAQLCIQAMKEAIFGQYNNLEVKIFTKK